ncbi:hypothetical protein ABBQ32_009945 [Trebouxia sp. C0010 RCD-2024]
MALLRQIAKALPSQLRSRLNPCAAVCSRGVKTHTGIAGLDVDPNARETLRTNLEQALVAIKVIPEEAEYRKNVEATIKHKLQVVNSDVTDEEAEDQLDAQLEQYIKFINDELTLIPKMAVWAPWDVPAGHKVEVIEEQEVETKQQNATQTPGKK